METCFSSELFYIDSLTVLINLADGDSKKLLCEVPIVFVAKDGHGFLLVAK